MSLSKPVFRLLASLLVVGASCVWSLTALAQSASMTIYVFKSGLPVENIEVLIDGALVEVTNDKGVVVLDLSPGLQQLDADPVRGTDESHVPVPRRPVDRHTRIHRRLAHLVDIIDSIGEVAEMAAVRGQALVAIPVVGQLDRAFLLARGCHENQREPTAFVVDPPGFAQAQQFVERHGFFEIFDADHRVQIGQGHVSLLYLSFRLVGNVARIARQ